MLQVRLHPQRLLLSLNDLRVERLLCPIDVLGLTRNIAAICGAGHPDEILLDPQLGPRRLQEASSAATLTTLPP